MKKCTGVLLVAGVLATPVWAGWATVVDDVTKKGGLITEIQLGADADIDRETLTMGLREVLTVGSERAVQMLSRPGGFSSDGQVRIPLPDKLDDIAPKLRRAGMGDQVDAFELSINRAAEQAVAEARPFLLNTIAQLNFHDIRRIYEGTDDEATRFLKDQLEGDLLVRFAPEVDQALSAAGAASEFHQLAASAKQIPFLGSRMNLDLTDYVTRQTVDGLFEKLADEERQIRFNPAARSTELLKRLWGG